VDGGQDPRLAVEEPLGVAEVEGLTRERSTNWRGPSALSMWRRRSCEVEPPTGRSAEVIRSPSPR
jgi:hypothetical protein